MRNRQMLGDRADRIFDKAGQRAVVPHQFVCLKGLITGKKLITAVAAEHDLQMSCGKSRKQIERKNRWIGEGLIEEPRQLLHQLQHIGGSENFKMVAYAETCRDFF